MATPFTRAGFTLLLSWLGLGLLLEMRRSKREKSAGQRGGMTVRLTDPTETEVNSDMVKEGSRSKTEASVSAEKVILLCCVLMYQAK